MRRCRLVSAVFVLGLLLLPPVAWSCESTGMESCSMAHWPMLNPQGAEGCHEPATSIQQGSAGCEEVGEAVLGYYLVPVEQDPVDLVDGLAGLQLVRCSLGRDHRVGWSCR